MRKKGRNTTSFMFLLLTAAGFQTHNDAYEQNINIKQLSIYPETYNHKIWSAEIMYSPNHDATNYLYIWPYQMKPLT